MICKTKFEMVSAGDLKYHKVRGRDRGHHEQPGEGAGADAHGYWSSWRTCEREREPRTVTTGMEETNSPLSMWLQLGRACQAFVFVAVDLAISPESAQHQRAKARRRERRVVKGGVDFRFKGKGESVKGG